MIPLIQPARLVNNITEKSPFRGVQGGGEISIVILFVDGMEVICGGLDYVGEKDREMRSVCRNTSENW